MLITTRFVEAQAERIDLDRRMVIARPVPEEVYEIPYDHLVLAAGGVTNTALIPGAENALTFKTLGDAIFMRNYVIDLFERADVESDPAYRRRLLTFVMVGAGLVGVELVGELTEFTRNLCRSYPHVRPEDLRFELLESGPRIMPEMDHGLVDYAMRVLSGRGVNIRVNCPAKSIEPERVRLSDGEVIEAATIVLAAGVAPSPLVRDLPLAKDRKGRVAVDATMRSTSHPNVWALGDCAAIPSPGGRPYPELAQHALREANTLASNIAGVLHGKPPRPFIYEQLGTLAALGQHKAIGKIMKLKIRGFLAWWVWRTYYLLQMPRWDRRLRIVMDWTIALFFKNDIVQLDLFGEQHPIRRRCQPPRALSIHREVIGGEHPGEGVPQAEAAGMGDAAPAERARVEGRPPEP